MSKKIIQINNLRIPGNLNEPRDTAISKDDSTPYVYRDGSYEYPRTSLLWKEKNIFISILVPLYKYSDEEKQNYLKFVRTSIYNPGIIYAVDVTGKLLEARYKPEEVSDGIYKGNNGFVSFEIQAKLLDGYWEPVDPFATFVDTSDCDFMTCNTCNKLSCADPYSSMYSGCTTCQDCGSCINDVTGLPAVCEYTGIIDQCSKQKLIKNVTEAMIRYPIGGTNSGLYGRGLPLATNPMTIATCNESIIRTTGKITLYGSYVDPSVQTEAGVIALTGNYNGELVIDGKKNQITYNGIQVQIPLFAPVPLLAFGAGTMAITISGNQPGAKAYLKVIEKIL